MSYSPEYGGFGGRRGDWSPASPFAKSDLDQISFLTTPVELLSNDGKKSVVSHASGFFWDYCEKSYLITNWHVLSGLNVFDASPMNKMGFIPSSIRIYLPEVYESSSIVIRRKPFELPLLAADGSPAWIEHPKMGSQPSDVVAIEVPRLGDVVGRTHLNRYGFDKIVTQVGSDVFICGYPLKSYGQLCPSIWKRGSLASEPNIPVDGQPIFLVDAATTSGMSGSPVLRRVYGPAPVFGDDEKTTMNLDSVVATEFIGVYAGRLQSTELAAVNLGYCWYASIITEILNQRQ
jgi:hypothetical protein